MKSKPVRLGRGLYSGDQHLSEVNIQSFLVENENTDRPKIESVVKHY